MRGRGRSLGRLVANQDGVAEACRMEAVEALFQSDKPRHAKAAWTLLFFALWHRRHILGRPPAGDVLETLAAV
jgi:asparagine synthase (glutamine-hydrolysing)